MPAFVHGSWVQVHVDPDPTGKGPGFIRIEERGGAPGVAVLPIHGGHVGLVNVYRRPLRRMCLEIPRGFGGEGSGPRSDAVRELWEETGLTVAEEDLVPLGAVHPNSGILNSEIRLYAAVVGDPDGVGVQDLAEVQKFEWYAAETVAALIVADEIRDGFTIAAMFRAAHRGLIATTP